MSRKNSHRTIPVFVGGSPVLSDRQILETKELLRPDEVADILRVSRSSIYDMIAMGELESVRIRESVRVKSASVLEHLRPDGCV